MDRKKHPAIFYLQSQAPLESLLVLNQQEFEVYVRDFPTFLEVIVRKDLPEDIRQDLLENALEERTSEIEGVTSHPEMFLHTQMHLRYKKPDFEGIELLPESRAYKRWLNVVVHHAPPYLSIPVINVFLEGSSNDRQEIAPNRPMRDLETVLKSHPLVEYRDILPKDLLLKRRHFTEEEIHRIKAYQATLRLADTYEKQREVLDIVEMTLRMYVNYHNGIARYTKCPKNLLVLRN
jgi:pyrroloquinoline quinone (PQQ) biosynthesis protein C